jgi:anti-sigma regulatory factor (Ser/Thr protein kinase)
MNLLLLEPDPRLPKAMSVRLGDQGRVLDATGMDAALELAGAGRLDAAFGEASRIGDLARLVSLGVPCGLWTSRSVDELVEPARNAGISLIASKTHPIFLEEILMAAGSWSDGFRPGLAKYLQPGVPAIGSVEVSSATDVAGVCRQVLATLPGAIGSSRRLRLVLDELLTNSLHHGGGVPARLEWGCDDIRCAFVVRDAAGRLVPDEAMRVLDRHLHGEGLQDARGRGLHLCRIYADRLYVSVVPGKLTESAAIFWNRPGAFQGYKPIWILSTDRIKED